MANCEAKQTGEALRHELSAALSGEALRVTVIATPLGVLRACADSAAVHFLHFADTEDGYAEAVLRKAAAAGCLRQGANAVLEQLAAELAAYFADCRAPFSVNLHLKPHKPFRLAAWAALRGVPLGQTRSYTEQAADMGLSRAFVRAVAAANGKNPFPIILPCHRVIAADGRLAGYHGGLWRKRALLAHEKTHLPL